MATVKTVDVQVLNSARNDYRTYKLDNPKENLTRAQIAAAFQPAFTNSWLLTNNGDVAVYLGDTILNTSTKISLDGQDFYVTPNALNLSGLPATGTLTITGAQCQGYNFKNFDAAVETSAIISANGLTVTVTLSAPAGTYTGTVILVILGQEVNIPVTYTAT